MSMKYLTPFWLQFERSENISVLNLGCGVTAYNYDDAIQIVREKLFPARVMPKIVSVLEGVTPSALDQKHVVPNSGNMLVRGVWFPLGFD